MFDQTTCLHVGIILTLIFFAFIWIRMKWIEIIQNKELREAKGEKSYFSLSFRKKLLNFEWYQEREQSIEDKNARLFPLGVPDEYKPESILNTQIQVVLIVLGITAVVYIVTKFFIVPIMGIALAIYAFFMQDLKMNSMLKAKEDDFDNRLPQFENSLLMGLNAGASLQKAMEMAIDSMIDCPSKEEFELLWTQTKTSTSDPSFPYLELAKRVKTKDCDQFTNMIINGVRNGTSMSAILEGNSASMMENMKNRIHEQNEKNATSATVFTSAFVLLPMIVIFLAPMISSSM